MNAGMAALAAWIPEWVTLFLIVTLATLAYFERYEWFDFSRFSYHQQSILEGQWYRLVTYHFIHVDPLHVVLNCWITWSIGGLESFIGSSAYLRLLLLTYAFTTLSFLGLQWLFRGTEYVPEDAHVIGFSSMLVGLYTAQAVILQPSWMAALVNVAIYAAIIFALDYFLARRSLVGHASGIIAGLMFMTGIFRHVDLLTTVLLVVAPVAVLLSVSSWFKWGSEPSASSGNNAAMNSYWRAAGVGRTVGVITGTPAAVAAPDESVEEV
jgi:membrane associated rhomboid family serine protease